MGVMKRILMVFLVSALFFVLKTTSIEAACTQVSLGGCNFNQYSCSTLGQNYCCTVSGIECQSNQTQNNQNTQNQTTQTSNTATTEKKIDITKCDNGKTGIQTAIGCVPVLDNTNDFLSFVLRWAVGVGGGIAFLLILYAGFMIMSSSGNPERLKAGQELLTSALAGLILLIFSIFILRFIGVDILGLDKFGFGK